MIFPLNRGNQRLQACRKALGERLDGAMRERLILAVNEIAANIIRHARPQATVMEVCLVENGCIVRDDGGSFCDFPRIWREAQHAKGDMIDRPHLGLSIVRRLCPEATYVPRSAEFPYNQFILLLGHRDSVPSFFRGDQHVRSA